MIRPYLEYGSVIFSNCTARDSNLLDGVQRRALVLCSGALRRTRTSILYEELGWEPLEKRRIKAKLHLFYTFCTISTPTYLLHRFSLQQKPLRLTRAYAAENRYMNVQKCRLEAYSNSFFPDCVRRWNALDPYITLSGSLAVFKKLLSHHQRDVGIADIDQSERFMRSSNYSRVCKGYMGRLITQFRLGLSPLRFHLFSYNLSDNPFCPSCGLEIETLEHLLFDCSVYSVHRVVLLFNLGQILSSLPSGAHTISNNFILDAVIYGAGHELQSPIGHETNSQIFACVSHFLKKTGRFNTRL